MGFILQYVKRVIFILFFSVYNYEPQENLCGINLNLYI